jgi:alkyl hydroperoxide reductase subunit AhpC
MTLQLTESHQGAAPANWKHGDDVVVRAVLAPFWLRSQPS